MGKIIVIKWVKELGFNCLMGVINIVSGRFFSFFSMTRFLACANVLRLDEYDFLYLPLCKRKLDFPKWRQVIQTFGQKWPKMTKHDQKWKKNTKHILQKKTRLNEYDFLYLPLCK